MVMTTSILIATNHAGTQLVQTVSSIRTSTHMQHVPVYIMADTLPITPSIARSLEKLGCTLYWQQTRTSQAAKYAKLLKHCKTSHVILTQDDVLFDPDTLHATLQILETAPETTMVGVSNTPLPARSFLERAIRMGTIISNSAASHIHHADNYLACMGRVMTFPTAWLRRLQIPAAATALDAYLYFQNQAQGGVYRFLQNHNVYFRSPNSIHEHRSKGRRYRTIPAQMKQLGLTVNNRLYHIPLWALFRGVMRAASIDGLATAVYIALMGYGLLLPDDNSGGDDNAWAADVSTKDISV